MDHLFGRSNRAVYILTAAQLRINVDDMCLQVPAGSPQQPELVTEGPQIHEDAIPIRGREGRLEPCPVVTVSPALEPVYGVQDLAGELEIGKGLVQLEALLGQCLDDRPPERDIDVFE